MAQPVGQKRFKTYVGRGGNKRLQDLKGPFVQQVEGITHDLADSMVTTHKALSEANGPIPAFQEPLDNERIAALHLGAWFVLGNQEPTSKAALDYWRGRVEEPNVNNPRMAGPNGAREFQRDMETLWKNPKFRAIAFSSLSQELRQQLVEALQSGDHKGRAYRLKDGTRIEIEEDGDINEHLDPQGPSAGAAGGPEPAKEATRG